MRDQWRAFYSTLAAALFRQYDGLAAQWGQKWKFTIWLFHISFEISASLLVTSLGHKPFIIISIYFSRRAKRGLSPNATMPHLAPTSLQGLDSQRALPIDELLGLRPLFTKNNCCLYWYMLPGKIIIIYI